ncbi:Rad3-related DNA helicase [Clostridium algifaecis]|uniref:Rad3-related DNA helicase n=1 Tax=Clostridium algifaecis TaxID=1472040 RepID=A0ABS4KMU6_9CLOT|nr:ATP-dependent DNA helicase [Clostridium algifaecis]MBP2031352.1 Rad3-related DNA helicase [Clostridium algifaecis]
MDDGKNKIKISVRSLVEFIFRHGDLDSRLTSNVRALQGTKIHQKLQKQYNDEKLKNEEFKYNQEVVLKYEIDYREFKFLIEGRADGIIEKDGYTTVDEIKTVTKPVDKIDENYNIIHMAQVKLYAYIYAKKNDLDSIYVQLTYYNIDDGKIKFIKKKFYLKELSDFFMNVLDTYYKWAKFKMDWESTRNSSIEKLDFPFIKYRQGQRELAVAVYGTIRDGKRLFVQAPTGIGKTISTVFPAIKTIPMKMISKIFYLTAKTVTGIAAEDTVHRMMKNGLRLKTLTLTAKEKICFNEDINCNPEQCEFARGHYDRVNEAIFYTINNEDLIDREKVIYYSRKFNVCPFEFSLDLSLFCDFIICDYNYAFDPKVYLRRFFEDSKEAYLFLIDEAHNLVDRAREMFSAEIYKKSFLNVKKIVKKDDKIKKNINKINTYMLKLKKDSNEKTYIQKDKFSDLNFMFMNLLNQLEKWILENRENAGYEEVLELYFNLNSFIRISEIYNSDFVTYVENIKDDLKVKMMCIDPGTLLNDGMKRAASAVLFSATLSPIKYFKDILGGREDDYNLTLSSPFQVKNRVLLIANDVSTVYKYRKSSYAPIAEYVNAVISQKKGNYMVFFPSYEYMEKVYELFIENYKNVKTVIQNSNMDDTERKKFLLDFEKNNDESFVAFAVLGGIFSEGIDLKEDRLIGTIIVGVGLPKICIERNIIMDHFNSKNGCGYEYSYIYPGMNKILQASGRVIRTENDRGVILLIDRRFLTSDYKRLFPKEWYPNKIVSSKQDVQKILCEFWKEEQN